MGNSNLNSFIQMKNILPLILLSALLFSGIMAKTLVLDTFLIGKASDKKFSCLMSVLDKINGDSAVITDREDWSKALHEGVQQGIDVNTLLLQYQYFNQEDRDGIRSCELTLNIASERCKSVYGECENVTYNSANFS